MAKVFDDQPNTELRNQIAHTERELDQIDRNFLDLKQLEEEADWEAIKRFRYIDTIGDFWQGPQADRYANQAAEECRELLADIRNQTELIRGDLQTEAGHLRRRQDSILEERARLKHTEEDSTTDG